MRKYRVLLPAPGNTPPTWLYVLIALLLSLGFLTSWGQSSSCAAPGFSQLSTFYSGGTDPRSLVTTDFNNDGKADLAVINFSTLNVAVFLGTGTGSFGSATTFPVNSGPMALTSGRFNNDPWTDLAVTNIFSHDVSLYYGNGDGSFSNGPALPSGGLAPDAIVSGDFNGDAKADLAVAHFTTNDVTILTGDGNGNFALSAQVATGGTNPETLTAGDFNGDGWLDLAAAHTNSNSITVLLGNGSGGILSTTSFSSGGDRPRFITSGQLNNDNFADLVVSNENTGNVVAFWGSNSGTYPVAANFSSGVSPVGIAISDLNGDAKADLAVANYGSSPKNIAIYLGSGTGSFGLLASYASGGTGPFRIVAADFNSDGKPDLAASNEQSDNIGVLLYTCLDSDGDGSPDDQDCAPYDPTVYPGARDLCDGKDNNCNGIDGEDAAAPDFSFTAPVDPVPITSAVTLSISFSGDNINKIEVNWGDGSTSSAAFQDHTSSPSHIYASAGVYTLTITLSDLCGHATTKQYTYVVVYDPSDGFVTGGGWILSPLGAYAQDPALTGKAHFGFVAKYQKGQTVPTGNTQFEFQAGALNFKSSAYEWLVIAGGKAQFKGSGTINGSGSYGFLLSATDGNLQQPTAADQFRIKIWDKTSGTTVYDNQPASDDYAGATTALAEGAVVIHQQGATNTTTSGRLGEKAPLAPTSALTITAWPNPSKGHFILRVQSSSDVPVQVRVLDVLGRVLEVRHNLPAHSPVSFGSRYRPGLYFVEVKQGTQRQMLSLTKQDH